MSEKAELLYPTEMDLPEEFLHKVLKKSAVGTARKISWSVCGVLLLAAIAMNVWLVVMTGEYWRLAVVLALVALMIGALYFSLRMQISVSLRRWKEQNHEDVAHVHGGFTENAYVYGKGDSMVEFYYGDIKQIDEIDGVWVLRTKSGLLMFCNASQLSKTDRKSALDLLRNKNPKIKLRIKTGM